ncbi:TIGR02302 family protein [Nioella sp.]|uniref:TIGR02302 family protein n=1 Tax=Nioella sp. TaxID=1912091 RepID=UPI003A884D3D
MTERTPITQATMARLTWPLRLTRLGMGAERFVRAFWPVWTILLAVVAVLAFGAADMLPPAWLIGGLLLIGLALMWMLVRGLRSFRIPSRAEAMDRLDQTMPGRPLTALVDHAAIGSSDAQSMAVWQAHQRRMAERAASARAPEPDLHLNDRDPYGLRFMAATAFAMALLFGTLWRVADVGDAMAGAPQLPATGGPSWEGWVEPPLYTGLPSLYLNDILAEEFEAPMGSRITLRLYGDAEQIGINQSLQVEISPPDPASLSRQIIVEQSGELSVGGPNPRSWQIVMLADRAPTVQLAEPVEGVPPGSFQMTYSAEDDYGVRGGQAILTLWPEAADRRYGLTVDPEPREALVLDLPLPFRGGREEFSEALIEDLSQHPFANLPVRLELNVEDDAGQTGQSVVELDRLPGRRFFDPIANALVEMRRDLLWSRENAPRVAQLLRAITHRPDEFFDDEEVYRQVRSVIQRLEAAVDGISTETRDEVAQILWDAAIALEEGDLSDALEQLRRAQDRLAEAMRQGASDEEISQLMQELRDAMQEYMQELADNMEPSDGTDQPDQSGETMEMTMNDLEEMMRRIEELMQQGRMAEAQEMLDALRQMMENMQMTQGDGDPNGPRSPGQQAMEGLQDTLRGQQGLADEAFRDLQERFNPNSQRPDPGEEGQDGNQQGGQQGGENDEGSLAERQRQLLDQLREQAQNLPGRGTEDGEESLQQLEEAGRAMRDAIEELERGDLAEALDSQSEAMEALREGMESLSEALAGDEGDDPGQGQADGNMQANRPLEDPLGRQAGNSGAFGSDESFEQREEAFRRARELLDEIRRRSAEQDRPDVELDYLRRLLDRFAAQ